MREVGAVTAAVRMARSVPTASLSECAAAAGTTLQRLRSRMAGLAARGVCAQLAVGVAGRGQPREVRAVGMSHRACPPGRVRAGDAGRAVAAAGRGTAGWSARSPRGGRLAEASTAAAHEGYGPPVLWNPVPWTDAAPRSVLAVLAGSEDPHRRAVAARSAACPPVVLAGLVARVDPRSFLGTLDDVESFTAVAVNDHCPPAVLARLLDYAANVDSLASEHPRCPRRLLDAVVEGHATDIGQRSCAASNPNCSAAALSSAAGSGYDWVAGGAASNPNCPLDLLYGAAGSLNPEIVSGAASNPNCPAGLLRHIAARCSEDFGPDVDTKSWRRIPERIAQNPSCPPDLLRELLSESATSGIPERVANNPSCPPDLLAGLASLGGGEHEEVRRAVAANPNTPTGTLAGLADDNAGNVRRGVAANPNTPIGTLAALVWSSDTALSLVAAVTLSRPAR